MKSLLFDATYTRAEFVRGTFWATFRLTPGRPLFAIALAAGVTYAMSYRSSGNVLPASFNPTVVIFVAAMLPVSIYLRASSAFTAAGAEAFTTKFRVSELSLQVSASSLVSTILWSDVLKAGESTSAFYVGVPPGNAYIIPKRLISLQQIADLRVLLSQKVAGFRARPTLAGGA